MTIDQYPKLSDITDAIQWHEGLLLSPHHFQQLSLRQEQLLHCVMSSLTTFYWGVLHFEIDKTRLVDGQFYLSEIQAILPDGLMIAYRAGGEEAEVFEDLKPHTETLKEKNLLVYLKVARYNPEFLEGEQRYKSIGSNVKGMNQGEGDMMIPRLKPIISLSIGEEPSPPRRFAYFPLAEVTYTNQTWELTKFQPPCLRVSSQSEVGRWVEKILNQARSKAKFLAEQLHSSTSIQLNQPMSFSLQNVMQGLAASLPPLEAMLLTQVSHPYPLYVGLCTLAGSVASFTQAMVPPVFKPYNHNDLWSSFKAVGDFILNEVLENIQEFYLAVPWDSQNQNKTLNVNDIPRWLLDQPYYLLKLKPEYLLTDPADKKEYVVMGLKTQETSVQPEELVRWGESCLIASVDQINSVREKRIYGAARRLLDQGDAQLHLTPPKGVKLFRIEVTSESFIGVEKVLVVVNGSKEMPKLEKLMLYTKPRRASKP